MEELLMIVGFVFAAYAVVGNDAIQTLGTFMSSNSQRPWWVLWIFSSSILLAVIFYGIYIEQDISYEKFGKLFGTDGSSYPDYFYWWLIIPPFVLLVITRFGIPVSTTFLILSVFSSKAIGSMVEKSAIGYVLAFGIAIIIYFLISKSVEQYFIKTYKGELPSLPWTIAQWISTGFLWSMWLQQDMVNIFVYLYKPVVIEGKTYYLYLGALLLVTFQGILFYYRGGAIQKIVTTKTNTTDVRSATIIDFIYGLILLFLKGPIPLSTTWVFVGLLAGREFAVNFQLKKQSTSAVSRIVFGDLLKILIGLAVSIALAVLIHQLK